MAPQQTDIASLEPYWVIAARCLREVMDLHRDRVAPGQGQPAPARDIVGFLPDPAGDAAARPPGAVDG